MNIPPLCIIQARYNSTRLPGKMLLRLGDETLIARGWRIACEAFDAENCVVAIPASDEAGPLGDELRRIGARIFAYAGAENDVLGRFHACALTYRWHKDSVIVRYTPDDPFKRPEWLRAVAGGERLPVEMGGEAFTLDHLINRQHNEKRGHKREHIADSMYSRRALKPPEGVWTIDTQEQLDAARASLVTVTRPWPSRPLADGETLHFTHGPYTT